MSDTRQRIHKVREVTKLGDRLRPLLALCQTIEQFRGDPKLVVETHSAVIASQLRQLHNCLREIFRRLNEMERDMTYRERALRAERWLRQRKKK